MTRSRARARPSTRPSAVHPAPFPARPAPFPASSRSRHRLLAPAARAGPRLAGSSASSQDGGERRRSGHRPRARADLAGDPEHRHRLRGAHPPVKLSSSRDLWLPPPAARQEAGGSSAVGRARSGPTGGARGGGRPGGGRGAEGQDLSRDRGGASRATAPVRAARLSRGSCHCAAGGCGCHGACDPGSRGTAPFSTPRPAPVRAWGLENAPGASRLARRSGAEGGSASGVPGTKVKCRQTAGLRCRLARRWKRWRAGLLRAWEN